MIELKITEEMREGGASAFAIRPAHISIGSVGANQVDTLHIAIPPAWADKTVRLTFVPDTETAQRKAVVLEDTLECPITADISGAGESGLIMADAVDKNGYAAYSACCRYTAEQHPQAGGEAPAYSPDEYQQFVAKIEAYSSQAVEAKRRAAEIAAVVQQMAGSTGCVSFGINENGELVETILLQEDGENSESIILGPVSDYAFAVQNGYSGTKAEWLLSLKGDKGEAGDKGETGEKGKTGEKGEAGPAGADGTCATVQVGSVKTAAAGEPAAVVNRGSDSAAVLDFTIPQGVRGEKGEAGAAGTRGSGITACRFDNDGHLILTLHNYAENSDTEMDAGAAATQELIRQIQQNVDTAAGYAQECREISRLAKGYYTDETALKTAFPDTDGEAGWWAIVGSTDTIWVWDEAAAAWKNSSTEIDLGDYETKEETDQKINAEKQRAQTEEKNVADANQENLTWKLAFTATGMGSHNLPESFQELLIVTTATQSQAMTLHILNIMLDASIKPYSVSQYVTGSDNAFALFMISRETISHTFSITNNGGNNVTSRTSYSVYYR